MLKFRKFILEGRNEVVKALAGKAKTGGIDKDTFQKAHDLYKAAKLQDLKKLIKSSDTDVAEAIADIISRHDSKSFNSMYPRAKSGDYLSKIIREDLDEAQLDEISPKLARKAAAMSIAKGYEYGQGGDDDDELDRLDRKSDKAMAHVKKRQGAKGVRKTNRLANKAIFGRSRAFATEDTKDETE